MSPVLKCTLEAVELAEIQAELQGLFVELDGDLKADGLGDARELPEEERERFGVVLGTGIGGITGILEQEAVFQQRGARRVSPHFVPRIMANR